MLQHYTGPGGARPHWMVHSGGELVDPQEADRLDFKCQV